LGLIADPARAGIRRAIAGVDVGISGNDPAIGSIAH
jgi:hypothetical protein